MEDEMPASPPAIPLWLDCDPGHDDAFAILVAAHQPDLDLLGISTVHGNASLESTTWNALSILTALGRPDVPVHPGALKPFCREPVYAPHIHGKTGIDGTDLLPNPTTEATTRPNAVLAMRHALLAQPKDTAWLVATGTLTNVALLFATFPEVIEHIKGLSIMGGTFGESLSGGTLKVARDAHDRIGNITLWAEFNIYCDPEAAQSIFSNPLLAAKTTLIPLDVTHQALATAEIQQRVLRGARLSPPGTAADIVRPTLRQLFHDLLVYFNQTYTDVFGLSTGPPLHDPIAVAVLLAERRPSSNGKSVFDDRGGERWAVDVVTDGKHDGDKSNQVGRTTASLVPKGEPGVRIPRTLNIPWFWDLIEACLSRAEEYPLPGLPPSSSP